MKLRQIILCCLLSLLTALSLSGCNRTVLDMREYVIVTFDGLSGHATANVDIDREKLNALINAESFHSYISNIAAHCESPDIKEKLEMFTAADCFAVTLAEQYENLSTHDAIAVNISVCPELASAGETLRSLESGLGIKLKSDSFCLDANVDKGIRLDLFADIEDHLKYSSSEKTVVPSLNFLEDYCHTQDDFTFTRDPETENRIIIAYKGTALCSYDIVIRNRTFYVDSYLTMDAVFEDYDINNFAEYGYYVDTVKTVTVPNVGRFWNNKDDLDDDQQNMLVSTIVRQIENTDSFIAEVALVCTKKESSDFIEQSKSEQILLILYQKGGHYKCIKAMDLLLSERGTVLGGNKITYYLPTTPSLEGAINAIKEKYDIIQRYDY